MTPIDYAQAYFPYPVLPRIVGTPTFDKLKTLKKSLRENASSVQSDLGGGAFGHLGLILDDAPYHALTGHHYVRPVHPGLINIVHGTALHEVVRLREEHAEAKRLHRETIDLENTLKKQIIQSVEKMYIEELYNDVTGTITITVPEILEFLFTRYGEVDSSKITTEEDKVKNFTWNIIDPPVVIFNMLEDLLSISQAGNVTKTQEQLLQLGIDIIKRTGEFETALTAWFALPGADHNWANFKNHFTDAHIALQRVRGTSMRGSAFHQANATVAALSTEMNNIRNDLIEGINALSIHIQDAPSTTAPVVDTPPIDHQANATMSNQTALITAIQDLQNQIRDLNGSVRRNNNTGGRGDRGNNRGGRGNGGGRSGTPYPRRQNTSKYCWTHGACAHESQNCNSPADGHKNTATFTNKMGGNTAFCEN